MCLFSVTGVGFLVGWGRVGPECVVVLCDYTFLEKLKFFPTFAFQCLSDWSGSGKAVF